MPQAFVLFTLPPTTTLAPAPAVLGAMQGVRDVTTLPPEDPIVRFWKALPHAQLDGGGVILQLPGDTSFVGDEALGSRLYIRQDYKNLFELTMARIRGGSRGMAILGTPGIGKSMFSFYVLWRLCQEYPDGVFVYDRLNRPVLMFHRQTVLRSGSYFGFIDELEKKSTWYLVDGKPPMHVQAKTLLFTSPRKHNFHEFLKRVNEVDQAYMPVWSLEELQNARALCHFQVTETDVLMKFERFGGSARFVLASQATETLLINLDSAIASSDIRKLWTYSGELASPDDITHMAIHVIVDEREKYIWTHVEYASAYVLSQVQARLDQRDLEDAARFVLFRTDAFDAARRGYIFEVLAHRFFARGGPAVLRRLSAGGTDEERAGQTITVPARQPHVFSQLRAHAGPYSPRWDSDAYNRPLSKSFSAVDAIVFPDTLLQMTVGSSHPVKMAGVATVVDALEAAAGNSQREYKLVFVVPSAHQGDFKEQPYMTEANVVASRLPPQIKNRVAQYVMGLDLMYAFAAQPTH
jgi:hypothetical protein